MTATILSAQHCPPGPCCADPEKCPKSAAAKAAALNDQIVERVHLESGEVGYARKSICPVTGNTLFTTVEYCLKSQKFINASPSKNKTCRKSQFHCSPAPSGKTQLVREKTGNISAAQRAACFGANSRGPQNTGNDRSPVTLVGNN